MQLQTVRGFSLYKIIHSYFFTNLNNDSVKRGFDTITGDIFFLYHSKSGERNAKLQLSCQVQGTVRRQGPNL